MKDSSRERYRDEQRILHMSQALERIELETAETSRDKLLFDDRLTRAIILDFIVLGEAANNVSEEYCAAHPEVPWPDVAAFRHKLVHDYAGIDLGILWDAMTQDVPHLLPIFKRLVEELPPGPSLPENLADFL